MSIFTDIRLIFATFGILFSKKSTQGFKGEGGMTVEEENFTMTGIDYDDESLRAYDPPSVHFSDKPAHWSD